MSSLVIPMVTGGSSSARKMNPDDLIDVEVKLNDKKITGVRAGVANTDAANVSQCADATMRTDLASVVNGKGAALVAMEGAVGTVQAAVTTALANGVLGAAANAEMIQKRTVRIDKTTDAAIISGAAGGVKTITKNVGTVLPANARFIGAEVRMAQVVDNVTNNATVAMKVGGTDDDGVFTAIDMTTGGALVTAGYIKPNGVEAFPCHSLASQQVVAVMTATEDVNTLTQCDISIDLFFLVLA